MSIYDVYYNHSYADPDIENLVYSVCQQTELYLNSQAELVQQLETMTETQAIMISQLEAENARLTEMNQYCAYIFALVAAFFVYKIISSALSAIFGGG